MFFKVLFQWAQICDKGGYQNSWRADFCINWNFRENFKEGGNGESSHVLSEQDDPIANNWMSSLQYHHGLCLCNISLVDHPKTGDAPRRKDRPLHHYELGNDVSFDLP